MNSQVLNGIVVKISWIVSVLCALAISAVAGDSYHLAHTYTFGAAPGGREYFDYITVDPAARRVYLSHGTEVLVVNADSGALEGKIPGLKLCHGVALVPDQGRGFITDGEQGKIVIFDLKTLTVVGDVTAAADADSILYDPASQHVFSFNGDSRTSTVVDPATVKVLGSIDLGGAPEFAVSGGKGMIYDNLEDKGEVVAIDSKSLTIKSRWPITPAGSPAPMAIDRAHRRLFVSGRNPQMMVVMNADNGKVIRSFPISAGADASVYDPASQRVFSFNGDSRSSTVVDPATVKVVGSIDLGGAPEFAVSGGKGMIYNNLEDKGEVVAIDSKTLSIKSRWPITPAGSPAPMAIDREHRRLFVSGRNPQMMVVMNADNGKVIRSFPISAGADASVYDPKTNRIFVSTREGFIHVFHEDSPDQFSEVGKIATEFGAKTMGFDPEKNLLFVDTAKFQTPTPTQQHPRPRPVAVPGTFHLLVYSE